jgi:hypothetical protein
MVMWLFRWWHAECGDAVAVKVGETRPAHPIRSGGRVLAERVAVRGQRYTSASSSCLSLLIVLGVRGSAFPHSPAVVAVMD